MSISNVNYVLRARYGSVYKLHAAGRNIIVISSPKIISTLLRARSSDFGFVDYMYIPILAGIDMPRMPGFFSHFQELYGHAARLLTPLSLHPIMQNYNALTYQHMLRMTAADDSTLLSLDDFVFRCNYFAVYGALIGEDFQRAKAYNYYRTFDDGVSNVIRKLPFLSNAPVRARELMLEIVSNHLKEHWQDGLDGGQLDGASELMSTVVRTLKNAEFKLTEDEIARMVNLTLWGSTTNTVRLINWVMRYIVVYPDLQQAIRQEIKLARTVKYPQISYLLDMDPKRLDGPDFALLTSTIREVIRLLAQSVVLRQASVDVNSPDDTGRVHLSKGVFVFADTHSYHLSDDHFQDAQTFKPDRYMHDKPLNPSLSFGTVNHIVSSFIIMRIIIDILVAVPRLLFRYGYSTNVCDHFLPHVRH
jgi:cytochrome P450